MAVHGDTGGGLQLLTVDSREHAHVVVGATSGGDQSMVLIDHLDEMANDEWDGLDSFEFLL